MDGRPGWCGVCGRARQGGDPFCDCGTRRPESGWDTRPPLPSLPEDVPAPVPPLAAPVRLETPRRADPERAVEVWDAEHEGARVVVTLFPAPERPDTFDALRGRLARVEHAAWVPPLELGRMPDGRVAVVRPIAVGTPLDDVLRGGPLSVRRALAIAARIGQALDALHAAGLSAGRLELSDVVVGSPEGRAESVRLYGDWVLGRPAASAVASQNLLATLLEQLLGWTGGTLPPDVGAVVDRLRADAAAARYPDLDAAVVDLRATVRLLDLEATRSLNRTQERTVRPVAPGWIWAFGAGIGALVALALIVGALLGQLRRPAVAPPPPAPVARGEPGVTRPGAAVPARRQRIEVHDRRVTAPSPAQGSRAAGARAHDRAAPAPAAPPARAPAEEPTPAPARPVPRAAPEPPAAEDAVAPAAAPEPAVAVAAAPVPAPEPSTRPTDGLDGAWSGQRFGRPFTLELRFDPGGTVTGKAVARVGSDVREAPIHGSWSAAGEAVSIEVTETAGPRPATYTGRVDRGSASGSVFLGGRLKGAWSASR